MILPTAAFWSAIAALCSALSSLLLLNIHRRNYRESVRPELVLLGWARSSRVLGQRTTEVVSFTKLRNVGRGAALEVVLNADVTDLLAGVMTTRRVAIVSPGEEVPVDADIILFPMHADYCHLKIKLVCTDLHGRQYTTEYRLFVLGDVRGRVAGGDPVAPVVFQNRSVSLTSAPRVRLKARFARVLRRAKGFLEEQRGWL